MDCEDRRVKELTESILYDFLPAALNVMLPLCEDPLQELDADRCRVSLEDARLPHPLQRAAAHLALCCPPAGGPSLLPLPLLCAPQLTRGPQKLQGRPVYPDRSSLAPLSPGRPPPV
jgi:hypothetical protein